MREHRSCQEEGHICIDVIFTQHCYNRWQTFNVLIHRVRRTQEGAKLHQSILALIVETAHQFQVTMRGRFAIDDTVLLLSHQQAKCNGEIIVS